MLSDLIYEKKKLIFILPYLNVNTTSAERFKSFIKAAEESDEVDTEVITFNYNLKNSFFSGLSNQNVDFFYPNTHKTIDVKFNILQKFAFWSLNSGYFWLWRILQLTHLVLFQTDVFYPGNINKHFSKTNQETFVFCSGSHFSFFSTAKVLSKKFGFKLILDYRDPWTFGYKAIDGFFLVQKFKVFFGRKKEISLLNYATLITIVSRSLKDFFPRAYQRKVEVVPNGSNFIEDEIAPNKFPPTFNVVYAGTIYKEQLQEAVFFSAFKKFIIAKDQSKIKLQFLGAKNSLDLSVAIEKYDLRSVSFISQRLKKVEFLHYMNNASVFLSLRFKNKTKVISSKLSEYLNFRKPILMPVSDKGDMAESISLNNAGFVCCNEEEVVKTLNQLWEKFEQKQSCFLNEQDNRSTSQFTRSQIARDLLKVILATP